MEVSARKDCGYPGISPEECESRKCCFSNTIPKVPWCFFPISVEGNVGEHRQLPRHRQFSGAVGARVGEVLSSPGCPMPGLQTPGVASLGKTVLVWELTVIVNRLRSQFENVLNKDSFKKVNK